MKTVVVREPNENDIKNASGIIRDGGLVVFPTETVYGLGASALNVDAAKKIYEAKGRPSDNPLIIHLAKVEDTVHYAEVSPCFDMLAKEFMPGPLTVILPKKDIIPRTVTGGLSTVAVRVPAHPVAHMLIEAAGVPIAAPSANLSGRPSCTKIEHVIDDMNGRVDMILSGGASDLGLESTILLPKNENEVIMLRPGAITVEMLEESGFKVTLDKAVTEKPSADEKPLAPGMKYRHYAPKAELILLSGSLDSIKGFMIAQSNSDGVALVCYEEFLTELDHSTALSIGSYTDSATQAHRLFDILRQLDEIDRVNTIYAPLPSKDHIGLALYNRLLKAAGYTVLSV